MKNAKFRGFVRMFLFGCLAVCGWEAIATGGIAGKPNFIEGGFTYYYPTAQGNLSDNDWDKINPSGTTTNNVYGRISKTVLNYIPQWGTTNVIYLSRTDSFTVPTNCEFHGVSSYTGSRVTTAGYSDYLRWSVADGQTIFKASNGVPVDVTWGGRFQCSCYFTQTTGDGTQYARLDVCFVNRSDAFYRVPLNDTYYVAKDTPLWFRAYKKAAASPWKMDGEGKWSVVTNTADVGYDKFLITADANQVFHITSEDELRNITVHVVDPAEFSFSRHILYFDGTIEARRLSTILYECGLDFTTNDVASVVSADQAEVEIVPLPDGDWTLQAKDYFDVDREVTVTFKNGSVALLKITSMTGRCDETLCASVFPKVISGDFVKVLLDDDGNPCLQPKWEATTKTDNAPPGYTNVMRVLNAVLYHGKRYSVYIACQTPDFVQHNVQDDPDKGVLWCMKSLRKVICWLEDEEGRLFSSPNLCIANSGDHATHPTRFCLGLANVLYSNADVGGRLKLFPYLGTEVDNGTGAFFQGATADVYGYCAILACAEREADTGDDWDEMTVFLVEGVRTVTVTKEAFGGLPGERFLFEAVYTNCARELVTNRFSLASGQYQQLMVSTGGVVTVTEVAREGYEASVRLDKLGGFETGTQLSLTNVQDDHLFEFRNVSDQTTDPLWLWITDHEDAGDGLVHLAFEPIFAQHAIFSHDNPEYLIHDESSSSVAQMNGSLEEWVERVRQRQAVHIAVAEKEEDLKTAEFRPIKFREDKGPIDPVHDSWVWITADTSSMATNSSLCYKITVDKENPGYSGYSDEVLGTSVISGQVVRIRVGESTDAYLFTNIWEVADVKLNRQSRLKSILLVGGGGAGGGMTGGGGAGGEVRLITPEEAQEVLVPGTMMGVAVGKGGAPAQVDCAKYSNDVRTYDVPSHAPGRSGVDTTLRLASQQFVALGGGGGGSFRSTYPGVVKPYGQGLPGGNGGGSGSCSSTSVVAPTGGVARAAGGHVGGGAYPDTEKRGAGGGGGMQTVGQDGGQTVSGNGGEGVTLTVEGRTGVYGAGGGGGGNEKTTAGSGGTNAGKGGEYTKGTFSAADFPPSALGQNGADGYGAGGGGGALLDDSMACRGGHGGHGAAMIVLQDASVIDAVCSANVLYTNALLKAQVASLNGGQATVSASYAYARRGAAMPAVQPVPGGDAVKVGEVVAVPVDGLEEGTQYDFVFEFVDEKGRRLVVNGFFETCRPYASMAYQDEYLAVEGDPEASPVSKLPSGEYLLSWTGACTNVRVLVLRDLTFTRGLVVGGGGAGGSGVGAGGGGGGVRPVDSNMTVELGTELLVSVGAGGAAPGNKDTDVNFAGDDSSLRFGSRKIVAAGGGVGASRLRPNGEKYANGGDGASGGGGMGNPSDASSGGYGKGGAGIAGLGFAGGDGATRKSESTPCIGGGGGGASEVGQSGDREAGQAGKGGEGLVCDISGTNVVFGSGGGAGGDNGVTRGLGGTNAGSGGELRKSGVPGVDGTGSGGGGAGYYGGSGSRTYAGKGGDGAVIFRLVPKDVELVAETDLASLSRLTAEPRVKVLALGDGVEPATVEFAFAKKGAEMPEPQKIAENVTGGMWVTNRLNHLDYDTDYAYRFRLTSGDVVRDMEGEFHTLEMGFEVGYTNEFLVTALASDAIRRDADGECLLAVTGACTNVQILVRRDIVLARALLVGGGGAGGSYIGGGGGGGGVTAVDEPVVIPAETELLLTVGAGGAVLGNKSATKQNGDGACTTLAFGTSKYEALGGGAGASQNVMNGNAGANGGGGMRSSGEGGVSTNGVGFAGGHGCQRYDGNDSVGGGGGAAGARGADGVKLYRTSPDKRSKAGDGGEGLGSDITGIWTIYGSGGGAGADEGVIYGKGGTNGGDGGDHYAKDPLLRNGAAGVAGTGGGGGGAGYYNNGYAGGEGGSGTIVLDLFSTNAQIAAVNRGVSVGTFSAQVEVKVIGLGADVGPVKVEFALKTGEVWSDYETVAEAAEAGSTVGHGIADLDSATAYAYRFRLTGSNRAEKELEGSFVTQALDFEPCFEDKFIVVGEGLGTNPVRETESGSYLIVSDAACTNVQILFKRPLTLEQALVVGGGGAGGNYIGGGGGGGQVLQVAESLAVSPDAAMTVSVGAGGVVTGSGKVVNGDGQPSTLTVAGQTFTAFGGGAGGHCDEEAGGHVGASGGGGGGHKGRAGGKGMEGCGHDGGRSYISAKSDSSDVFPGGGGGAAEPGEDGGVNADRKAGKGGEGLGSDITGTMTIYGSGGGGGGCNVTEMLPGDGGTNGGAGGSNADTSLATGRPGVDGTGSGGGGGGFISKGYDAGKGGTGTVIIRLRKGE